MTLPLTNAVHAGGRELNCSGAQSLRHRGRAEEEAPRGLISCGLSVRNYNPHGIMQRIQRYPGADAGVLFA